MVDAAHREAVRAEVLGRLPSFYSPWVHLLLPAIVGLGLITGAALSIHELKPLELLLVPFTWIVSNAVEWRAHKFLLHRRTKPVAFLYDRHTPEHHVVYVEDDMAMRSRREFALVLIPAYGILLIFLVTSPITAALWWYGERNLGALFVITTMGYVLSYEWLHLSYHVHPDSFVGRRALVRFL